MYNENKNGKLGIIITIIVLICLVIVSNINNDLWGKISSPFVCFFRSCQGGYINIKNKLSKNEDYFLSLEQVKAENEKLKAENSNLNIKNQELNYLKAENKSLKEYMKLSSKYSEYNSIPGYVIQKDYSNYSKTIIINLGRKDGVEIGMTVVAEEGLVGYITSVEDNSSKVQTIIDTATTISGKFSNSDKTLVTRGLLDSNNKIKGNYIDNDAVINEGDLIITSGIGGIFPKNISVGKISQIVNTQNKTNRYVYIDTEVDFEKLSNVLVIK